MSLANYDAYFFDWDGTLNMSLEVSFAILKKHYNTYGLYPSDADIGKHFGDIRSAVYFGLDEELIDQFNAELHPIFDEALAMVPLYPVAADVLHALKAKGKKV